MFNRLAFFKDHILKPACSDAATFVVATIPLNALFLVKHIDDVIDFLEKHEPCQGFQDDLDAYGSYLKIATFAVFLGSITYRYLNTPVDNQQNAVLAPARPS